MTLFAQQGPGLDPVYARLRDAEDEADLERRAYLDLLWERARRYLDANFALEFARRPEERFWELRLAAALLDLGFELEPAREHRPDFATRLPDGRRLWIEATAASLGDPNNLDRPPDLEPNRGFRRVPVEQLLLRYTQRLEEKRLAFESYEADGVVSPQDCRVIAISSCKMWPYVGEVGLPRVLSAVFPIGDEQIVVDRETGEFVRAEHLYRGGVVRRNGALVATDAFLTPQYAHIGGLVHDSARLTGWRNQGFARFGTVNNPLANCPLPEGWFPAGSEYRVEESDEGYRLREIKHDRPGSPG